MYTHNATKEPHAQNTLQCDRWQLSYEVCNLNQSTTAEVIRNHSYNHKRITGPMLHNSTNNWQCNTYMYISITTVQNYTGKYHEFVAICIATSAQHE